MIVLPTLLRQFLVAVLPLDLSELKTLKEWSKPVPMLVDDSVRASLLPSASATLKSELLKAKAQTSLYEKYLEFLGKAFSQF